MSSRLAWRCAAQSSSELATLCPTEGAAPMMCLAPAPISPEVALKATQSATVRLPSLLTKEDLRVVFMMFS